METNYIYSVSEITTQIKVVLEKNLGTVWVRGEISNLAIPSSGHKYFTIKDRFSQLKAVLFRHQGARQTFTLADGLEIIASGVISVYEPRGEYQLIVEHVELVGSGALYVAFEKLKERLLAEGLFDAQYKKSIVMLPQRIGIITSISGAVIRDILNILTRRFFNLQILISPVRVQGDGAAQEMIAAIDQFESLSEETAPEVIILARGGGSIEDLWAFNDEALARRIFKCNIPIISAVGHETDFTIADFCADLRAPTPSAAAELVISNKEELIRRVASLKLQLTNKILNQMRLWRTRLTQCRNSQIFLRPYTKINDYQLKIDDLVKKMTVHISHQMHLWKLKADDLDTRLINATEKYLTAYKNKLEILNSKIHGLNPQSILSRGYSITFKLPEGTILKDASHISSGCEIKVHLYKGELDAIVKK